MIAETADQRRYPRVAWTAPVRLRGRDIRQAYFEEVTQTLDLSPGGALVATSHKVKEGAVLDLTLRLPMPGSPDQVVEFQVQGTVIRIEIRMLPVPTRRLALAFRPPLPPLEFPIPEEMT